MDFMEVEGNYQTLTKVLESIDAHIYVADMDSYEIRYMNKDMQKAFGEDFTGEICYEVFRGEDKPCKHCTNELLLDDDGVPADVHIWEGQNPLTGQWYVNHDRALCWHDGRLARIQIATDITERIQAEQTLKEEEARYRTLFSESPIVLWEEDMSEVKKYIDNLQDHGVEDWRCYFDENESAVKDCLERVKILNVNATAIDFYEADSAEEVMNGLDKLFTEESFQTFIDELVSFAGGDTFFEREVKTKTFTEKTLFAWMRVTIPKGFEDTWEKAYVSAIDISTLKAAEEELKRRTDEMAALHAVSLDLATTVDLELLLKSITARATDLLEGFSGGLYLCDSDKREVRCVVSYRTVRDFSGTILKFGEGAAGIVAETGLPLIIDDYRIWEKRAQVYDGEDSFQTIISVPIVWKERIQGVLNIMRDSEDRKFSQEDLDLLSIFANHAAIAIENARLLHQIQRHAGELEQRVDDRTYELRTMVNVMAGREGRMADLKEVIKKLRRQIKDAGMTPVADDPLNMPLI